MTDQWTLVLHGGAGVTPGRNYSEVEAHLLDLARRGADRLADGASSVEATAWAVAEMEASGLYVAGRGSSPNRAGVVEFDAAIMDGAAMRAGAVAAIQDVQSPIGAARAVMEQTPHVLLAGEGATLFAREAGLAPIGADPGFFRMPVGVVQADIDADTEALGHGTVGAVARDRQGRLAAATSTGGIFGKRAGRVGDTPIPGIGTWADGDVAISCTGVGEYFILAGGAGDVAARMRYAGLTAEQAAARMLARVAELGGDGGLIGVCRDGKPLFAWNSGGLKRAATGSHFDPWSAIT